MRGLNVLYGLIGVMILGLLMGCQDVEPGAPQAIGFDSPLKPERSYVAGPISFSLAELQAKINRELDPVLVGKDTKGGKAGGLFSFRVQRSGPVNIQYIDQLVRFSAPLELWLDRPFQSSADKPFCALNVNFRSPLSVTSDWRLSSRVKFIDYQWIREPEIRILGQEISLTRLARNVLEKYQTDIESAIDSAVYKDLRLDRTIAPIWRDIQKPLLINREYGLWVLPIPLGVAASPISGNDNRITTHLRITLDTETDLSPSPPKRPLQPLPRLERRDTVTQLSKLQVLSSIPYADINRMLARTLGKEPQKIAMGMLTIKGASVYGSHKNLIVKTTVTGLVDGTLYLRGRPVFDTLTNTLSVKDLDFDADTESALARFSGSIIHKGLRSVLERLLTIPLGDEIAKLPQKISAAFEKGGAGKKADLDIQSFRFLPRQIAIRPDGIQALITIESNVGLRVQKL